MIMARKYVHSLLIVLLLFAASSFFCPQPVAGASTTVRVPQDYASIQDAINTAPAGFQPTTILISPGTYLTELSIPRDKDISLVATGQGVIINSKPPVGRTIGRGATIEMGRLGPCSLSLNGITIKGGIGEEKLVPGNVQAKAGGGILCYPSFYPVSTLTLTLENCVIENNTASWGAGIYASDATIRFVNSIIRNNSGYDSGGIYLQSCTGEIIDCTIEDNEANYGGGIYDYGSTVTIRDCVFYDNSADYYGGGIYNFCTSTVIRDCTFNQNSADHSGGGMYNTGSPNPDVIGCTFVSNKAKYGAGAYNICDAEFVDCTFNSNKANIEGGGMGNYQASPRVTGGRFISNRASSWGLGCGGGMANSSASPEVINVTFDSNEANFYGGGMYNHSNSSPALTACTFRSNEAKDGGGMYNESSSSPALDSCTLSSNDASRNGGGMYNLSSSPNLTNCLFTLNEADKGGGIYNESSSPVVDHCDFGPDNDARRHGGGIYNHGGSPNIRGTIFKDNYADNDGAGAYNDQSSPVFTSCIFDSNTARNDDGGGMYNDGSTVKVLNCTFFDNRSKKKGAGMYNKKSSMTITNCIIRENYDKNNKDSQIYEKNSTRHTVTYSNVKGGWTGTGNIDRDPRFVDPHYNYQLQARSPCIDSGTNSALGTSPGTDFGGNTRILDGDNNRTAVVDMGAYEYVLPNAPPVITLTARGSDKTIILNGSITDPDPDSFTVTINWDDGQSDNYNLGTGKSFTKTYDYTDYGTYNIRATVDDGQDTGHGNVEVTLANTPPLINIIVSSSEKIATVRGTITDPDSSAFTVIINWEDGQSDRLDLGTDQSFTINHAYTNYGTYNIRATVNDGYNDRSDRARVTLVETPARGWFTIFFE